nr:hypothetical protein [Tanacetum cinerariifolium]
MDHQYPTVAKIPVLDTGKFEQWQFRIQQYLQHEHYALWEVIEFGDSYKVPKNSDSVDSRRKDGRTVTVTTNDMQKKKNNVKARTTLLLSFPDEHQLSKYKTVRELWAAILKTFGGNEATKKTKKNPLKQHYGNFRAEGSETLEQTFSRLQVPENADTANSRTGRTITPTTEDMQKKKNDAAILKTFGGNEATKKRKKNFLKQQYGNFKAEETKTLEQTFNILQVIVSQLQFMDVDIEKDDLNQKFLTSLAPEWLIHTIVWRNMNDLDSMSLDYLYNHLKVYEAEVQKKPNPQDMAFISSSNNSNNEDGNTVCVTTATTAFPTGGVNVATISQDTASAFIASQSNGS